MAYEDHRGKFGTKLNAFKSFHVAFDGKPDDAMDRLAHEIAERHGCERVSALSIPHRREITFRVMLARADDCFREFRREHTIGGRSVRLEFLPFSRDYASEKTS